MIISLKKIHMISQLNREAEAKKIKKEKKKKTVGEQ